MSMSRWVDESLVIVARGLWLVGGPGEQGIRKWISGYQETRMGRRGREGTRDDGERTTDEKEYSITNIE